MMQCNLRIKKNNILINFIFQISLNKLNYTSLINSNVTFFELLKLFCITCKTPITSSIFLITFLTKQWVNHSLINYLRSNDNKFNKLFLNGYRAEILFMQVPF